MSPDLGTDLFAVAVDVTRRLERVGVRYVIGGSIASSLHGEPRSTLDVDVVADLLEAQVAAVVAALGDAYYIDPTVALDAVCAGASFNVVHVASTIKVDVFVAGADPFELRRLETALEISAPPPLTATLRIDTAEHTLLRKLEWYRRGGEISERQWRDVRAIVALQGQRLNVSELRRWSLHLGVDDLLTRVLAEAGLSA
ncbi:MAG: hypothetical protein C0503_04110 [Gemmatimonas sp.]|nr:hypothetical protein [Gemmatimonas sp.]